MPVLFGVGKSVYHGDAEDTEKDKRFIATDGSPIDTDEILLCVLCASALDLLLSVFIGAPSMAKSLCPSARVVKKILEQGYG